MATIKRLESGNWRVQIARRGVRESKSFPTKAQARDWASLREHDVVVANKANVGQGKRLILDVFDKYTHESSPKKRGTRWEIIRFERFKRDSIAQNTVETPATL